MNHRCEALIGFVAAHRDTFEFLQFAEEILDQMPPFIHLLVDFEGLGAARMLRNDNLGTAVVERCDNRVAVERLVPDQRTKIDPLNERLDANSVKALSWQQDEVNQIAQRIDQSEDFGRHTALGLADRLILRPPFAPCP